MTHNKRAKKSPKTDWHPADIVAAVRKRGTTMRQLSVSHGLHPGTLRHAIERRYWRGQDLIAEFLGTTPQQIWPSRYEVDGSRRRAQGYSALTRRKCNAAASPVNGKRAGRK